jgi:hypothetical protein
MYNNALRNVLSTTTWFTMSPRGNKHIHVKLIVKCKSDDGGGH